ARARPGLPAVVQPEADHRPVAQAFDILFDLLALVVEFVAERLCPQVAAFDIEAAGARRIAGRQRRVAGTALCRQRNRRRVGEQHAGVEAQAETRATGRAAPAEAQIRRRRTEIDVAVDAAGRGVLAATDLVLVVVADRF